MLNLVIAELSAYSHLVTKRWHMRHIYSGDTSTLKDATTSSWWSFCLIVPTVPEATIETKGGYVATKDTVLNQEDRTSPWVGQLTHMFDHRKASCKSWLSDHCLEINNAHTRTWNTTVFLSLLARNWHLESTLTGIPFQRDGFKTRIYLQGPESARMSLHTSTGQCPFDILTPTDQGHKVYDLRSKTLWMNSQKRNFLCIYYVKRTTI